MSNFTLPLGIDSLAIVSQSIDEKGNIIFDVKSTHDGTPCRKCGKLTKNNYGFGEILTIGHVSILDRPVYLRIRVVRYQCLRCEDHPTTSERYNWMERKAQTTKALDNYINRRLINSTIEDVSRKEDINYHIVESALNRCVDKVVNWDNYTDLETLGIDEIALKKGHNNYAVIVSAKDKKGELTSIAVLPNRLKETVKGFFEGIPPHLQKTVKTVCTDMYDGFVQAATEVFGIRAVVIDRYHVAKLYREPLDQLRLDEMKRLKGYLPPEDYAKLDGMMWILRRKHECLSKEDMIALELLYVHSPLLKKAHQAALKLTNIFNRRQSRKAALTQVNRWIISVKQNTTSCFQRFINTLEKYKSGILNYFKSRKNSGFVEGLNNKIKVLKRRCYGLSKTESIFRRLFLDLQGYKVFS